MILYVVLHNNKCSLYKWYNSLNSVLTERESVSQRLMVRNVANAGATRTMFPKNVNLCSHPTDGNDRPAHALN